MQATEICLHVLYTQFYLYASIARAMVLPPNISILSFKNATAMIGLVFSFDIHHDRFLTLILPELNGFHSIE